MLRIVKMMQKSNNMHPILFLFEGAKLDCRPQCFGDTVTWRICEILTPIPHFDDLTELISFECQKKIK